MSNILTMSLKGQCRALSLELNTGSRISGQKTEIQAFNHFVEQGYCGSYCEFGGFRVAIQSLCLDALTEVSKGIYSDHFAREDACLGSLMRVSTYDKSSVDMICAEIEVTQKNKYISAFYESLSHSILRSWCPGLTLDFAWALFDAVPRRSFVNLVRWLAEDWDNRNGWPDLTLVKDNKLRFVEVKTTDKLHASQISTIPALVRILGVDVSVLQLRK